MHQTADQEEAAAEAEIKRMSAEMDRLLAEMKQIQQVTDRLHKGNLARLDKIEAVLDRMAAK